MNNRELGTILVTYPLNPESLLQRLESLFSTVLYYPGLQGNDYSGTKVELPTEEAYQQADVLFTFRLPANLTSAKQMPNLKLLHCVGAGTAQLTDTEFIQNFPAERPLSISSSSGIHATPIGEHVMMAVMFLQHNMVQTYDITRQEKRWANPKELGYLPIQEIRGQTFGVCGYGHLGSEIARLASCFGARVLACTRSGKRKPIIGYSIPGQFDVEGNLPEAWYSTTDATSFSAFLSECDVVVNTLPLSKDTRLLFGRDAFCAMKNTAIYVNVGRGPTTDTDALMEALQSPKESQSGKSLRIGSAVLDVTDPEPLPDNHPLFSLPNVFLTPHSSWTSSVNFVRSTDVLEENKRRFESGQDVLNEVAFSAALSFISLRVRTEMVLEHRKIVLFGGRPLGDALANFLLFQTTTNLLSRNTLLERAPLSELFSNHTDEFRQKINRIPSRQIRGLDISCTLRQRTLSGNSYNRRKPTFNPDSSALRRDLVLLDRFSVHIRHNLQVGDVVTLRTPTAFKGRTVKRIVALEGDIVQPLQKYSKRKLTIPPGHCWVEGDEPNNHSVDSNTYGAVPIALVDARIWQIVWPYWRFGPVKRQIPSTAKARVFHRQK